VVLKKEKRRGEKKDRFSMTDGDGSRSRRKEKKGKKDERRIKDLGQKKRRKKEE